MNKFTSIYRRAERSRTGGDEEGFTLIELLIVLVILPLIIGGVALAMITGFRATDSSDPAGTASRLADSHDTQITSSYFVRDVQNAQFVSTKTSPAFCGAASQLVGLRWIMSETSPPVTVNVSYGVSSSSPYVLVRRYCQGAQPESDSTVSHDLFSRPGFTGFEPLTAGPVTPLSSNAGCPAGASSCASSNAVNAAWVQVNCLDSTTGCGSAAATVPVLPPPNPGIKSIQLTVREFGSGFTYTLTGVPRQQPLVSNGPVCTTTSNPPCLPSPPLLLLGTGSGVIGCVGSNGTVTVNGLVGVDSSSDGSISMQNSTLTSTGIYSTDTSNPNGAYSGNNPYSGSIQSGAPVPDPYEDTLTFDGPAADDPNGIGPQGTQQLEPMTALAAPPLTGTTYHPGYYPGGLTITGNQTFTFASGVYVFNGNLKVSGGAAIQSAPGGVLFYVYNGIVDLSGGGNVALTALPTSYVGGNFENVVIWESELNGSGGSVTLGGNGNVTSISGTVYTPTGTVSTGGNGSIKLMSLTANKLSCNGNGATSISGNGLITTPQPSTVVVNNPIDDLATVFGSVNGPAPTGTVTFYYCTPAVLAAHSTSTCSSAIGTLVPGTNPVALAANGTGSATATSPPLTPNSTGTWCFAGHYSGDGTYSAADDASADECFSVTAVGPFGVSIASLPNPKDGTPNSGDQIIFTYSAPMNPGSILAGWNGITTPAVTVNFAHAMGSSGPDVMTVSGVNLGSVNLGGQYVKNGSGKSYTVAGTISMSGGGTIVTIKLTGTGSPGTNVNQNTGSFTMVWTPSASATDTSNNPCLTTPVSEASAAENF